MSTIGDLVNEVLIRTENRTSDANRATIWLRDALLDITMDSQLRNEFDELEVIGPKFNLTANPVGANPVVQEYAFSNFLTPGDYNTSTLGFLIWTDPPSNFNRVRLSETSYQDSDRISPYPGLPTKWYRYGDMAGFSPPSDRAYQVQARIYRMHPVDNTSIATINATTILLAQDWNEVLIWAAVLRGFTELLEFEKATSVRTLLYGDPEMPQRPGLLQGKKKRHEREAWRRQKALRPIVRNASGFRW
jgi:hypothetical protein